jgi:hypothetical protein
MTYTYAPKCAARLTPGRRPPVLHAMLDAMPDTKPTLPPGPADAAALEHALRLAKVDADDRRRTRSGLMRDLAEGWAALGRPAAR